MPVENADRQNVFQLSQRVSPEVLDHVSCFYPFPLVDADAEPLV